MKTGERETAEEGGTVRTQKWREAAEPQEEKQEGGDRGKPTETK